MLVLLVTVRVKPEHLAEFLPAARHNAERAVADEGGCLRFDICSIGSDENRFLLYELYTDAAAFAAHKAAPHFAQWRTVAEQVLVGQVNTSGELLYTHTSEESA